jgi:hypothetical protein
MGLHLGGMLHFTIAFCALVLMHFFSVALFGGTLRLASFARSTRSDERDAGQGKRQASHDSEKHEAPAPGAVFRARSGCSNRVRGKERHGRFGTLAVRVEP